jgi:hypothetical protein
MADEADITLGWYDNSLTTDEARMLIALDQQNPQSMRRKQVTSETRRWVVPAVP